MPALGRALADAFAGFAWGSPSTASWRRACAESEARSLARRQRAERKRAARRHWYGFAEALFFGALGGAGLYAVARLAMALFGP